MARCCDRCGERIDPCDTIKIKFQWNFRQFIDNITLVMQRESEGVEDPWHYYKKAKGKFELCKDCTRGLLEYIANKE